MKTRERKVSPVSDYFIYTPSKTAQKMFLYPVQCGVFTYEPGYKLTRSSFDSFLLMYIQKGTMQLEVNEKTHAAKEKQFALIDCYSPHGYSSAEGAECLWLHFDGPLARCYYEQIVSRLGNVFFMVDSFPVLRKMNSILGTFSENRPVREPLLSKYICDILTEFMLYHPSSSRNLNNTEMIERAVTYINEHFSEEISISRLADMYGLSVYYFIRVFKRETGYTPHDYIISRRMASARYLLKYTRLTIKEICFNTGFSSESVFCSAFKKHHGVSPQGYRQ